MENIIFTNNYGLYYIKYYNIINSPNNIIIILYYKWPNLIVYNTMD